MAGGGGAWKVAYADFVTAMMAFFMVMWITSQSTKVKEAVSHYFSDPFGAIDGNGKSGGYETSGPLLNMDPGSRFNVKPTVIREYNSKQLELGTIVYFEPGSAELNKESQAALDALVPYLDGRAFVIDVRGHASQESAAVKDSPFRDIWTLSCARCITVQRYLEDWEIPAERIRLHQAGLYEPVESTKRGKRLHEDDRVEVFVPREVVEERNQDVVSDGV
jgi:chemotaxis protein MotB